MFELERLFTLWALELPENGTLVVTYHVALKTVHIGERLVAHLARLEQIIYDELRAFP